jgi:Rrf2 family protein
LVKLSEGVEWGAHCAVVLSVLPPGAALPTGKLAEYHAVPVAYLAKHLQAMSRAGILESTQGPKGGYRLARPPAEISLLEVVEAIDGGQQPFRCTEIRRRGPAAAPAAEYRTMCGIHRAMAEADAAWRSLLRDVSIADLLMGAARDSPAEAVLKFGKWFEEVLA